MSEYTKIMDVCVSIDPGQLQNRSAISVLIKEEARYKPDFDPEYVRETKYRVVALQLLPMMIPYNEQVDYVLNLCKQMQENYQVYNVKPGIVLEAGGVGLPVLDLLCERMRSGPSYYVYPIRFTGGFYPSAGQKSIHNIPKAEVFQVLNVAMQNAEVEINDVSKYAPILREEFRNFKITYRESGMATMEAGRGHDDLLFSVGNGLYFLKKRILAYAVNPLPERSSYYTGSVKPPGWGS